MSNHRDNNAAAESEHTQENISYIRTHVDNIERMTWFQLAASPNRVTYVKEEFAAKQHSARVYLALADGPKTQDELMKRTGMSRANISKILSHLERLHFIDNMPHPTGGKRCGRKQLVFKWTDAESILKLSKIARDVKY
jgi:predicted transcriptional regulator